MSISHSPTVWHKATGNLRHWSQHPVAQPGADESSEQKPVSWPLGSFLSTPLETGICSSQSVNVDMIRGDWCCSVAALVDQHVALLLRRLSQVHWWSMKEVFWVVIVIDPTDSHHSSGLSWIMWPRQVHLVTLCLSVTYSSWGSWVLRGDVFKERLDISLKPHTGSSISRVGSDLLTCLWWPEGRDDVLLNVVLRAVWRWTSCTEVRLCSEDGRFQAVTVPIIHLNHQTS